MMSNVPLSRRAGFRHLGCRLPRREGCRLRASSPYCAPFSRLYGVNKIVSLRDNDLRGTVCEVRL